MYPHVLIYLLNFFFFLELVSSDLKAGGMRVSARVQTISSEQEQSKFHARRRLFERAGACFEGKLYKSECERYE